MIDYDVSLQETDLGDAMLVKISGSVNTAVAYDLRAKLLEISAEKSLLLDLFDVSLISSSFVGALFVVSESIQKTNNHFIIVNPSERVSDILKLTGLIDLFRFAQDQNEALEKISITKEKK